MRWAIVEAQGARQGGCEQIFKEILQRQLLEKQEILINMSSELMRFDRNIVLTQFPKYEVLSIERNVYTNRGSIMR
jgi:hypothetical protein